MDQTRVFKSYEYTELPGSSDGLWSFDFAGAGYFEDGYAPLPRRAPQPRRAAPSRKREREWIREVPREHSAGRRAVRSGARIAPGMILGFCLSALLLVLVLLAQIRMTAISDHAAGLENEILSLRQEQNKLLAEYEASFPLAEVERFALEELGMQKPRPEQIIYLNGLGAEDRAVVIEAREESAFSLGLASAVDSLWAYFGGGQ